LVKPSNKIAKESAFSNFTFVYDNWHRQQDPALDMAEDYEPASSELAAKLAVSSFSFAFFGKIVIAETAAAVPRPFCPAGVIRSSGGDTLKLFMVPTGNDMFNYQIS